MQDLLQRFSLREFRLLLLGIGAVLTCIAVALLVIPNAKAYQSVSREAKVLQQASRDGEALETHLQEQHEKIQDLNYRLHGDMAGMPVRQIESYVIGRLQRISWGNDIELVSVEPTLGNRVEIFQEMIFNVQLSGEYVDLYQWLWETRNELGFVVVKEYGLERRDDNDDEPLLLADLSLATYRAVK